MLLTIRCYMLSQHLRDCMYVPWDLPLVFHNQYHNAEIEAIETSDTNSINVYYSSVIRKREYKEISSF